MSGLKYQAVCDQSTYDIWTLRKDTSPFVQIENEDSQITYKSINEISSLGSTDYATTCELTSSDDSTITSVKNGINRYHQALRNYYESNKDLLNKILTDGSTTPNALSLNTILSDFENDFIEPMKDSIKLIKDKILDPFWKVFGELVNDTTNYTGIEEAEKVDIMGWVNCSILGKDYNVTMNTIKTTFVNDLKVVTFCSLASELLIIALYFIIISLATNIRDKELEKTENKYDVESRKDEGEIYEIVENNKYKDKYDYE